MTTQIINQNKTLAAVLHLSVFTKYFFPLGNFLFPMLLWLAKNSIRLWINTVEMR